MEVDMKKEIKTVVKESQIINVIITKQNDVQKIDDPTTTHLIFQDLTEDVKIASEYGFDEITIQGTINYQILLNNILVSGDVTISCKATDQIRFDNARIGGVVDISNSKFEAGFFCGGAYFEKDFIANNTVIEDYCYLEGLRVGRHFNANELVLWEMNIQSSFNMMVIMGNFIISRSRFYGFCDMRDSVFLKKFEANEAEIDDIVMNRSHIIGEITTKNSKINGIKLKNYPSQAEVRFLEKLPLHLLNTCEVKQKMEWKVSYTTSLFGGRSITHHFLPYHQDFNPDPNKYVHRGSFIRKLLPNLAFLSFTSKQIIKRQLEIWGII